MSLELQNLNEKERLTKTSNNIEKRGNSIGLAFRLSTELVSGIVVGSVMGWSLDKWLGSQPWFFLIFFILGIAAGIINVIKTAKKNVPKKIKNFSLLKLVIVKVIRTKINDK